MTLEKIMSKKILRTIYHVTAFIILLITLNLLLDFTFQRPQIEGWHVDVNNDFKVIAVFILLSFTIGISSIIMMIYEWISKKRLEFYLKPILLSKTILIIGITVLLFL